MFNTQKHKKMWVSQYLDSEPIFAGSLQVLRSNPCQNVPLCLCKCGPHKELQIPLRIKVSTDSKRQIYPKKSRKLANKLCYAMPLCVDLAGLAKPKYLQLN